MNLFSPPVERLRKIAPRYDLVIVGGGIYGAALLWEATLQGLSALLLEKGDFGGATSANSLKIIHGGIRYLQQLDLNRIRESAREQNTLLRIAPHLVQPLPCLMLTEKSLKRRRETMALAFKCYEWLKGDQGRQLPADQTLPPGRIISLAECRRLAPAFCGRSEATGGALWWDAQVYNSERLVLEFVLSAVERGGHAFNYLAAKELRTAGKKVVGVLAKDGLSGREVEIAAGMVVNSAGPWVEKVLGDIGGMEKLRWAKAVNLLLPRNYGAHALGVRKAAEPGQEQRLLFLAPWRGVTMAGTWYFPARKGEEHQLTPAELAVCRRDLEAVLPPDLQSGSISFSHLGLVPVEAKSASAEPQPARHYRLIDHAAQGGPANLLTVLGVKYTTARDVAAKTIALVLQKTGRRPNVSSDRISLRGGRMASLAAFRSRMRSEAPAGLSGEEVEHLLCHYGSVSTIIFQEIDRDPTLAERVPGTQVNLRAELEHAVAGEQTYTLADLILRRTGIGSHQQPAAETMAYCAEFMAHKCGWGREKQQAEIEALQGFYRRRLPDSLAAGDMGGQ